MPHHSDGDARRAFDARLASAYPDVEFIGPSSGDPVEVVPYSSEWAGVFAEWSAKLEQAIGSAAVRVDHIGSTAVATMPAKPIVDIQISVLSINDEDSYVVSIESFGVRLRSREDGHRYLRPAAGTPQTVHIHVCETGSQWERDHLLFRDYLRHAPGVTQRYAQLKLALAERFRGDRIGYTEAKSDFIRDTLQEANTWADTVGWEVDTA